MIMLNAGYGQNQEVGFNSGDAVLSSNKRVSGGDNDVIVPIGPVVMTVAETLTTIEASMAIPEVCDATLDRVSMVADIFADAIIEGAGTVTYQANTNITGVLSFDKAEDRWVELNSLQDDLSGKNRSVFMWVKSELDVKSSRQVLFGMNAATGSGNVSNLLIDNSGENLEIYDGGNFQSASFDMGDGKWHYVGYTYDHSTTETVVYIDGIENDRFNNKQEALVDTRYSLGQEFDGTTTQSDHFSGDMAEISIWDEVLTVVEIREGMSAKIDNGHTRYANLVGYYSVFGSCTDDISMLTDHSGKGNHGVMQNFTVDFKNVQAITGFNSIHWYDNLVWKEGGTQVATGGAFTASLVVGNYEFIATRDFVESSDIWSMTASGDATPVDNIADEILCEDGMITRSVSINQVTYLDFEETADNYIEVNSVADDLVGKSRSVFMWVNKESNIGSGDFDVLFGLQNTDVEDESRFYIRSTEKLALWDGDDRINSTTTLGNDVWYFVGYTYNHATGEAKIFVNGTEEDSGILDMPVTDDWLASFGMKYDDDGPNRFLDAKMAEITIWDKVLDESEITSLMGAPALHNTSNLVAAYGTLSGIADNRLRDHTSYENDGLASHSSIIVNDLEESLPDYDASVYQTISWKTGATEFDVDAVGNIDVQEGTTNYVVSYGSSFFPKTEEFSISYTELIPAQPVDVTAATGTSGVFGVEDIPGAVYQWYEKKEVLIRKVNGDDDFPGLNRPTLTYSSVISEGENHIYVATSQGLLVSEDQGETWDFKRKGLASGFSLFEIRDLAVEGDVVLVTGNLGVAVSLDKGNTWRTTLNEDSGLVTGDVGDVVQGMNRCFIHEGILYATSRIGRLLQSADDGRTWTRITRLGSLFGNTNVFVDGDLLMGTTANATNGPGVFIPGKTIIHPGGDAVRVTVTTEDFGLTDTDRCTDALKIGDRYLVGTNKGLFSSTDLDNWTLASEIGSNYINQLLIESNKVYAYSFSKVYLSEDNGLTWTILKSVSGSNFDITGDKIYAVNYQTLFITADRETLKDDTNTLAANSIQGATTHELSINNLTLDLDQSEYYVEVIKDNCTRTSDVVTLTVVDGPFVTSVSPATGTTDIAIDVSAALTFNTNVSAGAGNIRIVEYDTDTEKQSFTVAQTSISGAVLTLPVASLDNNTKYYITLEAGIVQDSNSKTNTAVTDRDQHTFTTVAAGNADVTPPVKPAVTHISDDTGVSSTDGITSDRNLFIYGTAEANATVEIFSGTIKVGTVQADANGDWTLDITGFTLTQSTSNVTVEAIDAAGNRSVTSDIFVLTIDFSAPVKPAITGISDDTGVSSTDGITSDRNLLVHGRAEAEATVDIFSGTFKVGSVQADANGDWTLDITAFNLTQNTSNVTAEAIDAAGNRGLTSDIFVLTIDYTAPAKPIIVGISDDTGSSNSDGITSDRNLLVHGTAEVDATVDIFSGTFKVGTVQADANGDWTLDITAFNLTQSTSNVTAEAIDAAGNRGFTSDIFVLTIDFTAPAKPVITHISDDTGSSSADGITSDRNLLIHGIAEADATVEVFSPGGLIGTVTADANGDWMLDISAFNLPQIVASTTAEAIDVAGNRSATSDAFVITIDFTAPAKPVITRISDDTGTSATDGITSDRRLLIHGTAEADATVEVFSPGGLIGSATADANGDWTLDITAFNLPEMVSGTTAEAIDVAGNRSATSDSFVITIDFTSPDVVISIDNNSVSGYLINATFSEDVSGLALADISVAGGTASALSQVSANSYTFLINSTGTVADVSINANVVQDIAGNDNTASNQLSLGFTPVSAREDFSSLQKTASENVKVRTYPNPASSWLTLDLSAIEAEKVDVVFVNTSGVAVFSQNDFEGNELKVDISGYKSGMYLVLISADGLLTKKKVLVRK